MNLLSGAGTLAHPYYKVANPLGVWQLGTGTQLRWDRLRVPWLRESQGYYSRKVWLVKAHPKARKVPGTQRPAPSRPTSLKGITYIQSYYRHRRLAGRGRQGLQTFLCSQLVSCLF